MPTITVNGMSCGHCQKSVKDAIAAIPGVEHVDVDLAAKTASWVEQSAIDPEVVKKAVRDIGFDPE